MQALYQGGGGDLPRQIDSNEGGPVCCCCCCWCNGRAAGASKPRLGAADGFGRAVHCGTLPAGGEQRRRGGGGGTVAAAAIQSDQLATAHRAAPFLGALRTFVGACGAPGILLSVRGASFPPHAMDRCNI